MSLAAALIIVIALVVALFGALGLVMSRPKELRPHRPHWRGRHRRRHGGTGSQS